MTERQVWSKGKKDVASGAFPPDLEVFTCWNNVRIGAIPGARGADATLLRVQMKRGQTRSAVIAWRTEERTGCARQPFILSSA